METLHSDQGSFYHLDILLTQDIFLSPKNSLLISLYYNQTDHCQTTLSSQLLLGRYNHVYPQFLSPGLPRTRSCPKIRYTKIETDSYLVVQVIDSLTHLVSLRPSYNRGHKIMKHFKILVQVLFTTNKVVYDIQYKKYCIRVASGVEKQQKICKYWKNLKNGWKQSLAPSFPSRNKILVLVVKNYAKIDTKVSSSCPILLDFLTLFHKFCS